MPSVSSESGSACKSCALQPFIDQSHSFSDYNFLQLESLCLYGGAFVQKVSEVACLQDSVSHKVQIHLFACEK